MKRERKFDFNEIMWQILESWKLLLIFAIIGLLLGLGYTYKKSDESVKAQIATIESGVTAADLLTDEEKKQAINYANYLETIADSENYIQNSIFMQLDSNNVYQKKYCYYINVTNVEGGNPQEVDYKIDAYANVASQGSAINLLAEQFGTDVKPEYLEELIDVQITKDSQVHNCFTVTINAVDKDMADEIDESVKQNIAQMTQTISQGQNYLIEKYLINEGYICDNTIWEKQKNTILNAQTVRNTMASVEAGISAQVIEYGKTIASGLGAENVNLYQSTDIANIPSAKPDLVMSLLVAVIMAVLGSLLVVIKVIFSTTIQSNIEYEEFGLQLIGDLRMAVVSKMPVVRKLRMKINGVNEAALDTVTYSLATMSETKKICIVGGENEETTKAYELLKKELDKKNITSFLVQSKIKNANDMKVATESEEVLLMVNDRKEKWAEVSEFVQKCNQLNIKIIGFVVI